MPDHGVKGAKYRLFFGFFGWYFAALRAKPLTPRSGMLWGRQVRIPGPKRFNIPRRKYHESS